MQNMDIKLFVMQWNKIYAKTMQFLTKSETDSSMLMLYKIECTEEIVNNFTMMAKIINNDPQYIQAVRKAVNKKPHLSVVQGEGETMLMLSLTALA